MALLLALPLLRALGGPSTASETTTQDPATTKPKVTVAIPVSGDEETIAQTIARPGTAPNATIALLCMESSGFRPGH